MKAQYPSRIRATARIPTLTIAVGEDVATNEHPFLVRVKASYEPFLPALEDDPGCPEWFQFETLYPINPTSFYTKDGVCVTVQSYCDLVAVLSEKALESIEKIVIEDMKEGRYVY